MNNFDLKQCLGNVIGMPSAMKLPKKALLSKGVFDARLVKRVVK